MISLLESAPLISGKSGTPRPSWRPWWDSHKVEFQEVVGELLEAMEMEALFLEGPSPIRWIQLWPAGSSAKAQVRELRTGSEQDPTSHHIG